MTVLEQVIEGILEVLRNKDVQQPAIDASTKLDATLPLDSLDYAELVVRLQTSLGVDPFASGNSFEIRNVADLADIYEKARAGTTA